MAYVISDDCVACGTCIDECPVGAISEGEKYSQRCHLSLIENHTYTKKPLLLEGLFVYSFWKPVITSIVPRNRAFLP